MSVNSVSSDRNDPNRWGDQTTILVNNSDLGQTGVTLDFSKINDTEAYASGILNILQNSSINVNQFDLSSVTDSVTVVPLKSSTISNSTLATAHGTAVAANANRKELYIQNLGPVGLFVKLGAAPTLSSYNISLTGTYNVYTDSSYTGIVTTTGVTNNPSFIAWERT
jgi:hypothetical protein